MIIFQTRREFNKSGVVEDTFDDLQRTYDELADLDSEEVRDARKRWKIDAD